MVETRLQTISHRAMASEQVPAGAGYLATSIRPPTQLYSRPPGPSVLLPSAPLDRVVSCR
jgi:hypothetical protein